MKVKGAIDKANVVVGLLAGAMAGACAMFIMNTGWSGMSRETSVLSLTVLGVSVITLIFALERFMNGQKITVHEQFNVSLLFIVCVVMMYCAKNTKSGGMTSNSMMGGGMPFANPYSKFYT